MKLTTCQRYDIVVCVTPQVGVWIEMGKTPLPCIINFVTPQVGVWIEIVMSCPALVFAEGHSSSRSVD